MSRPESKNGGAGLRSQDASADRSISLPDPDIETSIHPSFKINSGDPSARIDCLLASGMHNFR